MIQVCCTTGLAIRRTQVDEIKVESAGSDHKPNTSQVPLLNEQTNDISTDIALCIFCGKHTFKKDRKLHKIKTAERLQNVKDATEGQNVVACHSRR
jgi:hypothetical protein